MGLLSILLSAVAAVCAGIGVLTTPIPVLGLVFAFGAPALALIGVMVGGSAMSRAKKAGEVSETGKIGVILNVLAFVPSLLVALTCGVCNALFSTGDVRVSKDFQFNVGPLAPGANAGAKALPPPRRAPAAGSDRASSAGEPPAPPAGEPGARPDPARDTPTAPPTQSSPAQPSLPPPPLPAGPGK